MTQEDIELQGKRECKSLVKKYNVPLNHLDFEYIKELDNLKELEKIYKILISNETGIFPELTQCAEDRLKELSPNNRLLRKTVSVLPKDCLDKTERNTYLKEFEDWKDNMETEELLMKTTKSNYIIQPLRRSGKIVETSENKDENKEERIKSCDYKSWENYDADKECLRIDLEQEKQEEEREKVEKIENAKQAARAKMALEEAEIDAIKEYVSPMAPEERKVMALKEKDIGNEYYKTHHLDEALKHYTRSVYIYPTATGYNNRAATYLKQCKFTKALADLNIVIEMEPNNVKARYRRAVAFQHKNEFEKALEDIRVVLEKEPRHVLARHLADRLREDCSSLPKKHKLRVKGTEGDIRIEEVTEEEMLRNYRDKDFIEINDFGLPKIMCNCNGKYINEPGIRHEDNVRFQHIRQRRHYESSVSDQSTLIPLPPPPTSAISMANQRIIQPAVQPIKKRELIPSLARGARRLEIVELDSISEDNEDSSSSLTACVVRDMRTSTKDEKTSANINIAQSNSSSSVNTAGGIYGEDFDKSDKTNWNKTIKESSIGDVEEIEIGEHEEEEEIGFGAEEEDEDDELGAEEQDFHTLEDVLKEIEVSTEQVSDVPIVYSDIMMESVEGDPQTGFDSESKNMWTEQWLKQSVSSVNNNFEKCMDLNGNHNRNCKIGGSGDASDVNFNLPTSITNCGCCLDIDLLKPQNFLERWSRTSRDMSKDYVIRFKAALLKGVCPNHVPDVFSLNLNDTILTDLIDCLCYFYQEDFSNELILKYVRAISKLQRFNIIICFIASQTKRRILDMFDRIGPTTVDLQQLFR